MCLISYTNYIYDFGFLLVPIYSAEAVTERKEQSPYMVAVVVGLYIKIKIPINSSISTVYHKSGVKSIISHNSI